MMPQTPMLSRPPNIQSRNHSGCDLLTFSLLPFPAVLSISGYLNSLHILPHLRSHSPRSRTSSIHRYAACPRLAPRFIGSRSDITADYSAFSCHITIVYASYTNLIYNGCREGTRFSHTHPGAHQDRYRCTFFASSTPSIVAIVMNCIPYACDSALKSAEGYEHAKVGEWNSQIINTILKSLIAATAPESPSTSPPYRFTVNSTIVQQGLIDKSSAADGAVSNAGKRGMHSASGAFWDVNRDGMWTFKYPGAEERGLDVIVSVAWFALG